MLAACSLYFRNILSKRSSVVECLFVEYKDLVSAVQLMYMDEIVVSSLQMKVILSFAKKLRFTFDIRRKEANYNYNEQTVKSQPETTQVTETKQCDEESAVVAKGNSLICN